MSVPPFLALPPGARRVRLATARGGLAAIDAPARPGPARGCAILVPGFTGSKEDFVAVLVPLTAQGWRVLALDLLGQYDSHGPDDEDAYALPALAADVADVVAALAADGGPVHVLGHSLGGLVVRRAVCDPAMRQGAVASVTLLCSGPAALPPERQGPVPVLQAVLPGTSLADVWAAKEAMDRENGWDPPPPAVHEFLHRRFLAANPWSLRAMATILLTAGDEVAALAATGVPVLVAHGADDDVWPLDQQAEMAVRLGTVAVPVPDCAHSPPAEAPTATAALLDAFWATCDPARGRRERWAGPGRADGEGPGSDGTSAGAGVGSARSGYAAAVQIDAVLAHEPSAARAARRLVVERLTAWGADALVDDATLVASELVTNAVRHACAPLRLRLAWGGIVLRVEVCDGAPGVPPLPRDAARDALDGRGMVVVDRIADRWGWERDEVGKVVWAELSLHA